MEVFWKEYIIILPRKREYIFDIRSQKTNCVFIQNYNVTNVLAGTKPHLYEIEILPNRTSIINRPFPLKYIYLFADKQTPVTIVETVSQNPVAKFIRQEVTKNVSIDTKNVSIDTVNTVIQNTPLEICQKDVFRPQARVTVPLPRYVHNTRYICDLGKYGACTINILLINGNHRIRRTRYRIFVTDRKHFTYKIADFPMKRWQPPIIFTFTNYAFKYLLIRAANPPIPSPTAVRLFLTR